MSVVSYSQHKFHPCMNVVTIDGEQVNGSWREDDEEIVIGMYAEHNMVDYYGNLLRDCSDTREKFKIVVEWIKETFKDKVIESTSGWSTKTQYWGQWKIKK